MSSGSLERILIVAENASVSFGGEAILPFHYFRLLRARGFDAHLIVHERVRAELLELFPEAGSRIHFVTDQFLQKLFFALGRKLPRRLDESTFGLANQMLTQRAQRAVIRRWVQPGTVVHQPIPVSPRFPSLLYGLGAPVVIGPLNGGMEYPPGFGAEGNFFSRLAIRLGRSFTDLGNAFFPGKRQAAIVLVANERTRQALPGKLRGQIKLLAENGVDLSHWAAPQAAPPQASPQHATHQESAPRFVFIGRLVDWKALDIVLEALAQVPAASLEIIGEGPMRAPWQALTGSLALTGRVAFLGWQTQVACAARLAGATALVLPSVYECGGAVVLEAMAAARPVIATAWGGPADYLDATCGLLIPPTSRAALVAGFAQAMHHLASNPRLVEQLGISGRERVATYFDWDRKLDAMLTTYNEALTTNISQQSINRVVIP